MNEPLFTIIIDAYYKPHFLKMAVEAIFRQTYSNLEIILINNGATPETLEYIYEVEKVDNRVKLIHFEDNQYSSEDPQKMSEVCLNAGLRAATGEYVYYQSYDDIMADDYVEKMVALFQENPECTSAAGIVVSIDADDKIMGIEPEPRLTNYRPRYMPGHILALACIEGKQRMFGAPGTIFTIKRDALIKAGGYHRAMELSQLYGIVPFGVTGFDETAVLYWRRHEGQLNHLIMQKGLFGFTILDLLKDWNIHSKWENVFGKNAADKIEAFLKNSNFQSRANWFVINLLHLRLMGAFRIFKKVWKYPLFWVLLPKTFWQRKKMLIELFLPFAKIIIKKIFITFPSLVSQPKLKKLYERVNR